MGVGEGVSHEQYRFGRCEGSKIAVDISSRLQCNVCRQALTGLFYFATH